jgi:hypothetical protein
MVFYATFNNISVISWQSVIMMEKTTDLSHVSDKLYHTVALNTIILTPVFNGHPLGQ